MKTMMLLLIMLFIKMGIWAQKNYAFTYGIDTALIKGTSCDTFKTMEYFSVNGKYPESSHSLQEKVRKVMTASGQSMKQNGFITFRFTVNCEGVPSAYKLYMTNMDYQEQEFDKGVVQVLFGFVQSLKEWKIKPTRGKNTTEYYNYYLSFQLRDGKIISVAP